SMTEFIARAEVGHISGRVVFVFAAIFYSILFLIALATINMTRATGEVLPRFGDESAPATQTGEQRPTGLRAMLVPRRRRRQLLAFIITDKTDSVSNRILTDLKRGVTSMQGKGMYTGKDRSILMCALTITEVHNLKAAVAKEDPKAVVIVSPAQEILGGGFAPLEEK
nr:YitT family protein [Anaerolineales bacterium]